MKSLSNDIRITENKQQQVSQDHKNNNVNGNKKLQQLIQANIECESIIKLLQKQSQKLEQENKQLDQQLENKKKQLQNIQKQLEEQQKNEQQNENQMNQWITNVQNYSGVPQQVINSLICLQYQGSTQQNQICLSCFQTMQPKILCKYLPCYHLFHKQCIDNHLKTNKLCPACGEPVSQ